jgi:hypothetical protein
MEDIGTDHEALLEDWRGGRAKGADLYRALREAMYQAARQGIGMVTSSDPDPHDVEDAVYNAFCVQFRDDDVRAAADQEVLAGDALGCLEALTDEQRDVVRATLMGRESLSNWARHCCIWRSTASTSSTEIPERHEWRSLSTASRSSHGPPHGKRLHSKTRLPCPSPRCNSPLRATSDFRTLQPCIEATCSAVCSTSTSELRERVCAPFSRL